MIQVSFTEQEINVLNQLIDVAIKSLGLQGAEAGVILSKKLTEAFNARRPQPAAEETAEKEAA